MIIKKLDINNCKVYKDDILVNVNDTINENDVFNLKVKAEPNCFFNSDITLLGSESSIIQTSENLINLNGFSVSSGSIDVTKYDDGFRLKALGGSDIYAQSYTLVKGLEYTISYDKTILSGSAGHELSRNVSIRDTVNGVSTPMNIKEGYQELKFIARSTKYTISFIPSYTEKAPYLDVEFRNIVLKQGIGEPIVAKPIKFTPSGKNEQYFNADFTELNYSFTIKSDVEIVANALMNKKKYTVDGISFPNADVNLSVGQSYFEGDRIDLVIQAKSGYKFDSVIEIIGNEPHQEITYFVPNGVNTEYFNSDFTRLEFSFNVSSVIIIDGNTVPMEDTLQSYTSVYSMKVDDFVRWTRESMWTDFDGYLGDVYFTNYTKFIEDIFNIPFKVPEGNQELIVLSDFTTDVYANRLDSTILNYDLGTIVVPEKYHNSYDYQGVECFLNVPFTKKIPLDTAMVVGSTIRIEYAIDVFTRGTTINIYSTFNDSLIQSEYFIIGDNIPFFYYNKPKSEKEPKIINKIEKPFIEVIRNIPYKDINNTYNVVSEQGKLLNYNGYVEIENIDLQIQATESEKDMILSLLKNGVYIK